MKKYLTTAILIAVVLGFGWWINNYPSFENKAIADITIYEKDSLLYDLRDVEPGGFVFNLKQDPRYMTFNHDGSEIRLDEINTHYVVKVDYKDVDISDIEFL